MAIKKEIIMVATRHGVTPPPSVERQLAVLELTSVLLSETKYVVYTYTMKGEVPAIEGGKKKKNGLLNWGSSRLDSCSNLLVDYLLSLCPSAVSSLPLLHLRFLNH